MLTPLVRVQNDTLVAPLRVRHIQRTQHEFGVQIVRRRLADDAPARYIKYYGQMQIDVRPAARRSTGSSAHTER